MRAGGSTTAGRGAASRRPDEERDEQAQLKTAAKAQHKSKGAKAAKTKQSAEELEKQRDKLALAIPLFLTAMGLMVLFGLAMIATRPQRTDFSEEDRGRLREIAERIAYIDRYETPAVQRFSEPFNQLEEEKLELRRERFRIAREYYPQFRPEWFEEEGMTISIVRLLFLGVIAFFLFRVMSVSFFYVWKEEEKSARDVVTGLVALAVSVGLYVLMFYDVARLLSGRTIQMMGS